MSDEDESVKFIQGHIDKSFSGIMEDQIIQHMYWMDEPIGLTSRAIAIMYDPSLPEDEESNLICLFPPFQPSPS